MLDVTQSPGLAFDLAPAPPTLDGGAAACRVAFGRRAIAVLFVALLAMTAVPILLHPLPPLSDYVNHLARMHVIAAINSDPDLARYYEIDWQVIPNLMMDLIVPQFERLMNVYLAGQVYTLLSFALIVSGTLALHRRLFGRWSPLPLLAFALLYNNVFLVGTMNYVAGIGLMLWAVAAWIALRERSWLLRLPVSALFVAALFFCHLFSLGVYGLALLAFELHRLWTSYAQLRAASPAAAHRRLPALLADFAATGLPFLPVLPLLMMSPTWGLWEGLSWELAGKIDGLVYVVEVYSHSVALLLIGIVAFSVGWALRDRALSFHAFGLAVLAVGAVIYLALPRVLFDTYMADQRLPISLAFILLACIDLDLRQRNVRRGLVVALLALVAIRAWEVEDKWEQLSPGINSFRQSVQLIDRGAKVAVAYADPDAGSALEDYGLVHADCIALIDRSALVTTEFTVMGKQVLHARPEYRGRVDALDGTPPGIDEMVEVADRPNAAAGRYWRHWTVDYDYLYVLFTGGKFENPDPAHLEPIFVGRRFMLYRIQHSQVAAANKPIK
jgi:hypothetical protein